MPGYTAPTADGAYLAYLDWWEQSVTALQDPLLREIALGGPDTAFRLRTISQVKLLALSEDPLTLAKDSTPAAWNDLLARQHGRLAARAEDINAAANADPCETVMQGGYTLPENRLYRVEIHTAGPFAAATYKWSRDNGVAAVRWLEQNGDELRVDSPGQDSSLRLRAGDWIELLDEGRELRGEPGTFVRIASVDETLLTIDPSSADGPYDITAFADGQELARRWDMTGATGSIPLSDQWLGLEGGIEIQFDPAGEYRTGDYWLIPARQTIRGIQWPCDGAGLPLLCEPKGIAHKYARLAFLKREAGSWSIIADARTVFASLTDIAEADNQIANKVNRF